MNIHIRPETSADHEAIRHVNRLAFGEGDEAGERSVAEEPASRG